MKCKLCGGETKELSANHYRCIYCGYEFEGVVANADNASALNGGNATTDGSARNFTANGSSAYAPSSGAQNAGATTCTPSANLASSEHGTALSGEEIYDNAINGVVEIYASDKAGAGASSSGFVVSEHGFLLTNAHAVLNESGEIYENIIVKTKNGEYRAFVIATGQPADGINDSIDLCLLYVRELRVKPSVIGDVSKIRNGQKVYLIGNSLGSGTCITSGIISDKERAIEGLSYPYIMTDAAANPGNSGGPLYNEQGEIIGVLVAGIDGAKGMNYAIPADVVKLFLTFVIQNTPLGASQVIDAKDYALAKNSCAHGFDLTTALNGLKIFIDAVLLVLALV